MLERIGAPEDVRLACQLRPCPAAIASRRCCRRRRARRGAIAVSRRPWQRARGRRAVRRSPRLHRLAEAGCPTTSCSFSIAISAPSAKPWRQPAASSTSSSATASWRCSASTRDPAAALPQALDAARRMARRWTSSTRRCRGDLDQPLRIGIGLHAGPAIVGEMGYGRAVSLTAIGDTVNTASRLETLTKELGSSWSSRRTARAGRGRSVGGAQHEVEIRGRQGRLPVRAVLQARDLTALSS